MSYRVWLKVIENDRQILNKQLFANHERLTQSEVARLGLQPDEEDEFSSPIDLDVLIDVFIERYSKKFNNEMSQYTWECIIELIKNPRSALHQTPDVYLIGDYLITLHQLREFQFKDVNSREHPEKRQYILCGL